jgi:hypothetical protein
MMTLDDVAAVMRERFTEAASKGRRAVEITAEEWNAMAEGIYLADKLEAFLANPSDDALAAEAAALIRRVRSGR